MNSKLKHFAPECVYLLIDNGYFERDVFVKNGTIIITLEEYPAWCVSNIPVIHRVAMSKGVLKRYKRAHDYQVHD